MVGEAGQDQAPPPPVSDPGAVNGFWRRVQEHKVIQWGVAYLGAALALAHGAEIVSHALHLPEVVVRVFVVALIVGFPIALTLAWYHGHRGLKGTSSGELAIVSVLILIAALVFAIAMRPSSEHMAETVPAQPARAEDAPSSANAAATSDTSPQTVIPNSVAVLPFENLSPKQEDAYFAAGIYEELLDHLEKIKSLNIRSRTTMQRYADTTLSIPEIGRELKVETVLEGSVRYDDNRVRITAQLIDAATDRHLWSESYTKELTDVFEAQADIAMRIADALLVQFSPEEQAAIEQAPNASPEAYALWLNALAARDVLTREALLNQAIAADPDFAAPYGWLAMMRARRYVNWEGQEASRPEERAEIEASVRQNAEKALSLDPRNPYPHTALSLPALLQWRWRDAEAGFRRTLEATSDWRPVEFLVYLMVFERRFDEAERLLQDSMRLHREELESMYGTWLLAAGRYDAAATMLSRTVAGQTSFVGRLYLPAAEIAGGNTDAAIEQLQLSESLARGNPQVGFLSLWAYSYSRAGRPDDARRLFEELQRADAAGMSPGAGGWAVGYLAIGDHDRALEMLETAARKAANHEPDEGFWNLMNLRMNITNDPVLRQPEFVDVFNRIRGD